MKKNRLILIVLTIITVFTISMTGCGEKSEHPSGDKEHPAGEQEHPK